MIIIKDVNLIINKKKILSDINLEIADGECFGLVGRNGSGKTMLMKVLCGFVPASSGEIRVNDKRIGIDRDFPENIGIIIENPGFLTGRSGFSNLKSLAELNKKIDNEKIRDTMKFVGLDPDSYLHVSKYSLGMRQRLGLAQAIMEEPSLLVLDEPFNGLDMDGVRDMREYLMKFKKQGKTIVMSSHNREDVDLLCDRSVYMDKGCIVEKL